MKIVYILFILLFFYFNLFSQDTLKYRKKEWATVGIGGSSSDFKKGRGVNGGVDYNHILKKNWYYQVGANHSEGLFWGDPPLSVLNAGIGTAFFEDYVLSAVFVGPGLMWGTKDDKMGNSKSFRTVGIAMNVHLAIKPLRDLGIGVVFFTNVNTYQSATGLRVVLVISSKKEKI